MSMKRRDFVLAAGALAAPLFIPASVLARPGLGRRGPNDQIGVGLIGMGKRAFELLHPFLKSEGVRVLAVCDVDTTRRTHAKSLVDKHYNNADCASFNSDLDLLAHPGIDAVGIFTPDHWHVGQVLAAARAKKDIYCEKPLTLRLREGKFMIDAVRKHDLVFQTGSQQRTEYNHLFVKACEYVRNGRLGKILAVHVGVGAPSKPCDLGEEAVEPGLDWDRWLGPAPKRPYHSILSPRGVHDHYPKWREYREYSGGYMTDFGAHHFDIAQWGLGLDSTNPVKVIPPHREADPIGCKLMYAGGVEMTHGGPEGITFIGTSGLLRVTRDHLVSIPERILKEPMSESDLKLPRHVSHHGNWIDCIRSRQRPICDVEVGARSIACAHLCNVAYELRRPLAWNPNTWEFENDAEANSWTDYPRRAGYELPRA
jgi:predicted dehydrogenase